MTHTENASRWSCSVALAALGRGRRRGQTRASRRPRSRSATPTPTAARPPPTARSARPSAPTSRRSTTRAASTGRKINYITYDDGYAPPKTVEMVRSGRRAGPGGAPLPDARHAVQHRDPQVHEPAEGAPPLRGHRRHQVERSEELPWTMGFQPNYQTEGRVYAQYVLKNTPTPRWASSTRTTTTGRTTSRASRTVSATPPRR